MKFLQAWLVAFCLIWSPIAHAVFGERFFLDQSSFPKAPPTFRASAYSAISSSTVINKPTGTISGDLMFAVFNDYTSTDSISTLSGWIALPNGNNTASSFYVFYKVAGVSEPSSYTWTCSSTCTSGVGVIASYTGTLPLIDVASASVTYVGASVLTITLPSITTLHAGALLAVLGQFDGTACSASGFTSEVGVESSFSGACIIDKTNGSIGATGSVIVTGNGAYGYVSGILVQIYSS